MRCASIIILATLLQVAVLVAGDHATVTGTKTLVADTLLEREWFQFGSGASR